MILATPGPVEVHERVLNAMSKQVVSHRGPEIRELYESLIEKLRSVLKTDGDVFVLTSSGTGGIECAVSNLIEKDDRVLVPVFGVFSERFAEAAEFYSMNVHRLEIDWRSSPTKDLIERELSSKEYDIILLMYNETSTGTTTHELPEIARICKERGMLVAVDAVSAAGGLPLEIDKWGIDVCVVGSQKCFAGPPGLSIITVSDDAWKKIAKVKKKPFYFDLQRYKKFYEEKKETPFTPAINLFYGMNEALDIVIQYGLDRWIKKHMDFANCIYETLELSKVQPYAERRSRSPTVISVALKDGITDSNVLDAMRRGFRVIAAEGMGRIKDSVVRIANMGNITVSKTEAIIRSLLMTLKSMDADVELQHIETMSKKLIAMGYY